MFFVNLCCIIMDSIFQRKYILASFLSMLTMFLLSSLWHGVILTDFRRIQFPLPVFLALLFASYMGISIIITVFYHSKFLKINEKFKGAIIGIFLGVLIYLIAVTLGFSFNNSFSRTQSILDLLWQIVEQGLGGAVFGRICLVAEKFKNEEAHENN